jgi:hypothetical protein
MSLTTGESPRGDGGTLRVRLILALAVALAVAAWTWAGRRRPQPAAAKPAEAALPTRLQPEELSQSEAEREAPPVPGSYRREVVRPKPVQSVEASGDARDEPAAQENPGGPASRRRDEKRTLPEIFQMPFDAREPAMETPPATEGEKPREAGPQPITGAFAPFGRLVKCVLVETLDSVTARSEPIVGIVTQELDWNGDVIIPAGTEVFSYAKPEAVVDADGVGRLVDSGEWTLVLPRGPDGQDGRELILAGRAVDRREAAVGPTGGVRSWAIDDGADGLVGYALSTLDNREIKLFAAAAVSGMAQGIAAVVERQEPAPGVSGVLGATQVAPTLGNALAGSAGSGAVEVMNEVASRIRDEISKRGVYVRVPAGKEFYLFVEQTIDPRAAGVGLRLPGRPRTPR